MRDIFIVMLMFLMSSDVFAHSPEDRMLTYNVSDEHNDDVNTDNNIGRDSVVSFSADQQSVTEEKPKTKTNFLKRLIRGFSDLDTNYVEPNHYVYTAMLQNTYTYDMYKISSSSGQSITFSPDASLKIGPYFGWRWIFLGYTFDMKNFGFGGSKNKTEIDLSIYSSQIGLDLYHRRTGSDYKIRNAKLGDNINTSDLNGVPFNGINVGITGLNLYYIFNHRRFSYPAAFAQSTCQKVSCGSWMAGVGYFNHSISLDYTKLQDVINANLRKNEVVVDSALMLDGVNYFDINMSGGYAYNWVFSKNWLLCVSASVSLAFKHSHGESANLTNFDFSFDDINVDGIGRFGLVYNNMRWYAGANAIVRSYNYHKSRFATNNTFGSFNVYMGYNFGLKKGYRKEKNK